MRAALRPAPTRGNHYKGRAKPLTLTFGGLVEFVHQVTGDTRLTAGVVEEMINSGMIYVRKKNLRWN